MSRYGFTEADEAAQNNYFLAEKNFEDALARYRLGQETHGVVEMYRLALVRLQREIIAKNRRNHGTTA